MDSPLHRLSDIELALRMLGGDATPEEVERFNRRLAADPVALRCVLDVIEQEECLEWRSASGLAESAEGPTVPRPHLGASASDRRVSRHWPFMLSLAATLLAAVSFTGGLLISDWRSVERGNHGVTRLSEGGGGLQSSVSPGMTQRPIGRLVSSAACRWVPDQRISLSGELRYGESLNLLEGVAELRLEGQAGVADVHAEGPAGVVLTADGGCSISHGRLTATAMPELAPFVLETPLCQVTLRREGAVGVVVNGRDVEVHVFEGAAAVLVPWGLGGADSQFFDLTEGQLLSLRQESEGKIHTRLGDSQPTGFVSRSSMGSDQLVIPDEYVESVAALNPSLYWRFEENAAEAIDDSSPAAGNPAEVVGTLKYTVNTGNRALDLGSGMTPGVLNAHLLSSRPINLSATNGYSLEVWVKPSHYHLGTIASLIVPNAEGASVPGHGMMLELGGPRTAQPFIEQPGKIRFLHRSPPSDKVGHGVSCYSPDHYSLRKWQHVVATKDATTLRLYRNGELVASGKDDTMHNSAMKLLVGQIDESRRERQFFGQLDELAFYPHALSPEDVHRHYELVEQAKSSPREQTPPARPMGKRTLLPSLSTRRPSSA
ncbi:hypothetical protein KOR34_01620 [Posidoniimonas corsicana]|uniref:LamG-like jellyroll fold domain-containing protein n=1 Tax=Posidoniimonas corsicana TaxID=1938618 RepID=A0A5C5V9L8_9BACT|nr:LamG domain-containing protein [Posidoniimonas corsicana]TWT35274.1 hypothetical protein KOR34_01620 [Posidoniimonas corsicana]